MKRVAKKMILLCLLLSGYIQAEESPPKVVEWGAFVDTYYAYDTNSPTTFDRAFTTQPTRHNEFNVNLAFVEAKLALEKIRGRLSLQAGTSVQSNYSAEPTQGTVSGPSLSRHLQEATMGYQIMERLWVDGGIYFSHIGLESFISRDNWTYSRSLVADYSPYYQAGVKFSYQLSNEWSAQFHLLNGWQNISENNMAKSVGTQIVYAPRANLSFTYNTFIGKEAGFRHFHDFLVKYSITDKLQLALQGDLGFQDLQGTSPSGNWYGAALLARYAIHDKLAIGGRVEYYSDKNQIIVVTGTPNGFQTSGTSVNVDAQLHTRLVWRNELRALWSKDRIYPGKNNLQPSDGVFVTSLALTL